jgi:uncharacterized Ntn-hydrolase superfamily protein
VEIMPKKQSEFSVLVAAALGFESAGKTLHDALLSALPLGAIAVGEKPTAIKACTAALTQGGMSENDASAWCKAHRVTLYRAWDALRPELEAQGFTLKKANKLAAPRAPNSESKANTSADAKPAIDAGNAADVEFFLSAVNPEALAKAWKKLPDGRKALLIEALGLN